MKLENRNLKDRFNTFQNEAGSLDALLLKARKRLNRGEIALSLQALEEAAKIAPDNPVSYMRAAAIMRQLGRKKEWLSLLDRARSYVPAEPQQTSEHQFRSNPVHFHKSRPKRVLLLASKAGMVFNDCVYGFKKLGWETISELFGDGSHDGPEAHERLVLKIRANEPDLILSINHVGCDADGFILSALKHAGIPVIIWYVDNPFALLPEDNHKMVSDASLLACFDASYVDMLRNRTGVNAVHLPLGTNPERFRPANDPGSDQTWDISFVGNVGLEMAQNQRAELERLHPSVIPLIDCSINRINSGSFGPVRSLLKTSAQSMGITWEEIPSDLQERITMVAESHASAFKRIHMVCQLRQFNIKVIGDLEWQPYLSHDQLYPPVDYLNGLCKIYRKSLINLNISRFQLRSGVTQRVFDVPATRGFLLTDRTSELDQYLQPDREVVVYENVGEAREKTGYYLAHEKERKKMALMAYQRVINEHTYAHRINKLLNILGPL